MRRRLAEDWTDLYDAADNFVDSVKDVGASKKTAMQFFNNAWDKYDADEMSHVFDSLNETRQVETIVKNAFREVSTEYLRNFCVSDITKKSLDRLKTANAPVDLYSAEYDRRRKTLELTFFVQSASGSEEYIASEDVPQAPNGWYVVIFKFYKVKVDEWNESALRSVLLNNDVQVYSDDPSFYWQGSWASLQSLKAALFKFTGDEGDGTWARRHSSGIRDNAYITKHIAYVIDKLPELIPEILRLLNDKD